VAKFDVKSIILGGGGLASYAQQIQNMIFLPVIDRATASLEVLVHDQAPKPFRNRTAVMLNGPAWPLRLNPSSRNVEVENLQHFALSL